MRQDIFTGLIVGVILLLIAPLFPKEYQFWKKRRIEYAICYGTAKTSANASKVVTDLAKRGYENSGYFYIPDYNTTSGIDEFQIYIAKLSNKDNAIELMCQLKEKDHQLPASIYVVRLANDRKQFRQSNCDFST